MTLHIPSGMSLVLGDITIVIDIDGIHIKRYKKLI